MANVHLTPKNDLSSFRKMSIGTWRTAYDPQVYGNVEIRVEKMLAQIKKFREQTGKKLTITHVMAKVVGRIFEAIPDANAILRFNRIYVRQDIAVFFQVLMKDPETGEIDLSGLTIRDPEKKSLADIHDEFIASAEKVRAYKDKELEHTRKTFGGMPYFLLNFTLKALSFLVYTLNLNLQWAKVAKDPFGSAMVSNIGSIGLDEAYPPLVPFSRCPLIIAMGAVNDAAVVVDGELKVEQVMKLCATFDHRILDGAHATKMVEVVREIFENPESLGGWE